MLYLLSPAKSLDYDTPTDPSLRAQATKPQFLARSAELIDVLQRKTPAQVAELMSLSDALAALNVARYGVWSRRLVDFNGKGVPCNLATCWCGSQSKDDRIRAEAGTG